MLPWKPCLLRDVTMETLHTVYCIVGVAKIFQFTCTFFWSIPTYSRTLARSFSEK